MSRVFLCVLLALAGLAAPPVSSAPAAAIANDVATLRPTGHVSAAGVMLAPVTSAAPDSQHFVEWRDPGQPVSGFNRQVWIRVPVANTSDTPQSYVLEVAHDRFGVISLARPTSHNGQPAFDHRRAGLQVPADRPDNEYTYPAFRLEAPPHSSTEVLFRAQAQDTMWVPVRFWSESAFAGYQSRKNWFVGLGFGIIGVLALYNLIVGLISREASYLYLSAFLTASVALHLTLLGYARLLIWPEAPWLTPISFGPALTGYIITFLLFSRAFLNIAWTSANGRVVSAVLIVNTIALFVLTVAPKVELFQLLALVSVPGVVAVLICAVRTAWRRAHGGVNFLAAVMLVGAAMLLGAFNRLAGMPLDAFWIHITLIAANAASALLLAVSLAEHIRKLVSAEQTANYQHLISRVRVQEAELRARTSAAESEASSAFLATMSHEIRTPMNGVLGLTDLLAQTNLDDQQHQYIAALKRSGNSLMNVLNDILDYSKSEAGKIELEVAPTDLGEVVNDMMLAHQQSAADRGLVLEATLDPAVPAVVETDMYRLKQIIGNLLTNALKFTSAGSVSLELSMAAPQRLRIAVRDTGIGIADDAKDQLFERFHQADSSITRNYGGTGLGLAICHNLVALLGGTIRIEDNPGGGSVFIAEIDARAVAMPDRKPVTASQTRQRIEAKSAAPGVNTPAGDPQQRSIAPAQAGESVPSHPDGPLANQEVLVAEDNATNRVVIGKLLERWGAAVHFAEDGVEAVDAIRGALADRGSVPYSVILMDCEMPNMDGYTATRRIRDLESGAHIARLPIIAVTAHAQPEFERRARDAGLDDYVAKPVNKAVLLDAITRALEQVPGAVTGPSDRGLLHRFPVH